MLIPNPRSYQMKKVTTIKSQISLATNVPATSSNIISQSMKNLQNFQPIQIGPAHLKPQTGLIHGNEVVRQVISKPGVTPGNSRELNMLNQDNPQN